MAHALQNVIATAMSAAAHPQVFCDEWKIPYTLVTRVTNTIAGAIVDADRQMQI